MWWDDLADDELAERLGRRVTSGENEQNLVGILVARRDDPDVADVLAEILDRPAR